MKKRWILLALVCTLVLSGCFGKLTQSKEISYSQYKQKMENKESFILFIGANSCSACAVYRQNLNKVIKKYQVTVYYLDIDTMSKEERKELNDVYNYGGTPTTIFITNGQEESSYNRINGSQEYSKIVKRFQDNGYIKGE